MNDLNIPKPKKWSPRILYKYRSWQEKETGVKYQRKILTEQKLYFTCPKDFNDPFDSKIIKRYNLLTVDERADFLIYLLILNNPKLSEREIFDNFNKLINKGRLSDAYFQHHSKQFWEDMITSHGIFSTARRNDNILMWTHYANSHKGFCVGFDAMGLYDFFQSEGLPIGLFQINYTWKYPEIIPKIYNKDESVLDIFRLLSIKAKLWKYENEWRYVAVNLPNKSIVVDKSLFKSLILGCEMAPETELEIIDRVKIEFPNIKVYRTMKADAKFKLNIKEVDLRKSYYRK